MTIDILKFANSYGPHLIEMQTLSKVLASLRRWRPTTLREAVLANEGKKLENATAQLKLFLGGNL
ncbi:MAG TPA: hypothetical protein VGP65_15360 [Candidatus Angelobacter sp.]|nr:hypothetical protein [Candidatus Angelobacter sp.]